MDVTQRIWPVLLLAMSIGAVVYWRQASRWPFAKGQTAAVIEEIQGLILSADQTDLGEIWENKKLVHEVTITNQSGRPITVKQFQTSCGCLSIKPKSLTFAPREFKTVVLEFDTARRAPTEIGIPRRKFGETLEPVIAQESNVPPPKNSRSFWTLSAHVRSRVTFDTTILDFGDRPVCGEPSIARKTLATVHVPFHRFEARMKPDIATVRVVQVKENQFGVIVAPQTNGRPGRFEGEVIIDLVDDQGKRTEAAWLPVEGEVRAEVGPIPAKLTLPATKVGTTAEGMFLLQAPDDSEISIASIATDNSDLRIEPTKIPGLPDGRAFIVRLPVTRSGHFASRTQLTIRRHGQSAKVYTMDVFCYGLGRLAP